MIRKLLILVGIFSISFSVNAQVAIATDLNPPHAKAMLDIRSGSKGILIPRMLTSGRLAIAQPIPPGLTVFDLSTMSYWYYTNNWYEIQTTNDNPWTISGSYIMNKDSRPLFIGGLSNSSGNIAFESPTPHIVASSYLVIPGGAYFNDKNVFFERTAHMRGGINTDNNPVLSIFGGTAGKTYLGGPVGIMNNNPVTPLDITGGNWDLVNGEGDVRIGNGSYRLKIGVATGGGGAGAATIMQQGAAGGLNVLTLGSQGNNVLHINGNTNAVGIHNNNPLFPLSFPNTIGGKISLYGNSTTQYYGIGIQNGQLQFHTDISSSQIAFGYGSSDAFTTRMRFHNSSGNLYIAGALFSSYVFTPSDMNLKKDITPIESSLDKLNQLNGYTYHWKNETSDPSLQSGVIAQEIEKVLPNLVQKTENGTLAVNYDGLIPYLIQGVKEQQAEIDSLKKELKELKEKVKKSLN